MIGDKVVTWFIQNVIIPNQEIVDKPGFIITNISHDNTKTYLRDLMLPEGLFEKIEVNIVKKYQEKGKSILYSAGKKFGYVYSSLLFLPQLGKVKDKDIVSFAYFFARYLEGEAFASNIEYNLDLRSKIFKMWLKDYIICRHNGMGLIMSEGGSAGIWAWICNDVSIESVQTVCQGRGADRCEVVCAPIKELKQLSKSLHFETALPLYSFSEEYAGKNIIRETEYATNSLKIMLDSRFFDYKGGICSYKGKRLFMDDSHILFFLEDEINKLDGGSDILFDSSFEEGREIARLYGDKDWDKFITDLFPGLGFGDIAILNPKSFEIGLIYYPWTALALTSKYIIIRGLISGIITQCTGIETRLMLKDVTDDEYLTVIISAMKGPLTKQKK